MRYTQGWIHYVWKNWIVVIWKVDQLMWGFILFVIFGIAGFILFSLLTPGAFILRLEKDNKLTFEIFK